MNDNNRGVDGGLRLSSENDIIMGSTLSTSPDKKSFDRND